jgi:O-antigen ligase
MRAKKEIRDFLINCLVIVLIFTIFFGEKPIFDFAHIGVGLLLVVAMVIFIEYNKRRKDRTKN